jgi:hypothetical protein
MKQFLNKIWGDYEQGFRCLVSGEKMRHEFFELNTEAIAGAERKTKTDVWYAPSILSIRKRKIENVVAVKAFWLDIDIKPDLENAYKSITAAVGSLTEFIEKYDLPSPTYVKSGNGLHIYWILDKHITPDKWHPIAGALREACVEFNLLADHGITIDIARILRVPDTKNYKDPNNPKAVTVLQDNDTCTYEELASALSAFTFKVELRKDAEKANAQFKVDLPQTPKDANEIADRCPQLGLLRETKGNLPEPQWYAGLGVLALCSDGERIAHEWSSGYPAYSHKETQDKFERAKEFAPTTCSKFYEVNPTTCQKCPFYQKVSTPVQLGESVTAIALPQPGLTGTDVAQSKPLELPVPKPYLCGKEGVYLIVQSDDEAPERQRILEHPLWVSRLMLGEDGAGSEVELSWIDAKGKHRTASVRTKSMAQPSAFEAELRDRNVHFFWQIKAVIPYINACINHVAKEMSEETVYSKFGLTEDNSGFVLGNDLITEHGRSHAHISSRIDTKRVKMMAEKGTLAAYRKATKLLDQPQYWMHRFTVGACFGSTLFALSGNEGSILSLAGESSGGKTTSANLGIAAFADAKAFTIDPQSTMKRFTSIGVRQETCRSS